MPRKLSVTEWLDRNLKRNSSWIFGLYHLCFSSAGYLSHQILAANVLTKYLFAIATASTLAPASARGSVQPEPCLFTQIRFGFSLFSFVSV